MTSTLYGPIFLCLDILVGLGCRGNVFSWFTPSCIQTLPGAGCLPGLKPCLTSPPLGRASPQGVVTEGFTVATPVLPTGPAKVAVELGSQVPGLQQAVEILWPLDIGWTQPDFKVGSVGL